MEKVIATVGVLTKGWFSAEEGPILRLVTVPHYYQVRSLGPTSNYAYVVHGRVERCMRTQQVV